jgi:hypothetical protein
MKKVFLLLFVFMTTFSTTYAQSKDLVIAESDFLRPKKEQPKNGINEFDINKMQLYISKEQINTGNIAGFAFKKELESKKVPTTAVLNYFLRHPQLIPNDWRGKQIYFWGSAYEIAGIPEEQIPYIFWDVKKNKWLCSVNSIDFICEDDEVALILKEEKR